MKRLPTKTTIKEFASQRKKYQTCLVFSRGWFLTKISPHTEETPEEIASGGILLSSSSRVPRLESLTNFHIKRWKHCSFHNLSTTWNDIISFDVISLPINDVKWHVFCSCVDDVGACRHCSIFFFVPSPKRSHQLNSRVDSIHRARQMTWNNRELILEKRNNNYVVVDVVFKASFKIFS